MLVRPIKPEEMQKARDIFDIAFGMERKPRDPDKPEDPDAHVDIRAAFNEAGVMMGLFHLIPYTVWYEGHQVGMGGIGGVATLPEHRRYGSIRAVFDYCLREMYERGMLVSTLYPFSYAYYRKFGYETAFVRRRLQVKMSEFARFRSDESITQWMPGDDEAPLRQVYDSFVRNTNMAVCREDENWEWKLKGDPFEKRRYIYLWRDTNGEPTSYVILGVGDIEKYVRHLHVQDFACRGPGGTQGLFALLRNMSAAYEQFIWEMPPWIDPNTLFHEPIEAKQEIQPRGMARIINVGESLRLLRHPEAPGSYTLRVIDAQLPENDGVWQVEFGSGQAQAKKVQSGEADWTLDIRAFTQLVLGFYDVDAMLWNWPEAGAPANIDTLQRVFRRRKLFLADYF
ncbi:MAG: GNAT family N-acetyltransferase [Clostridia bacterium]|nr:GNAT family N-acetyltransferase [Clostridia bacterium]